MNYFIFQELGVQLWAATVDRLPFVCYFSHSIPVSAPIPFTFPSALRVVLLDKSGPYGRP